MVKLLIKFRECEQVSPDDYALVSHERLFDDRTKLSDVRDWILSQKGYITKQNGDKQMKEVFLSEPSIDK